MFDGADSNTEAVTPPTPDAVTAGVLEELDDTERRRVRLLRAVVDLVTSAAWRADGAVSAEAWLRSRGGVPGTEARRLVRGAWLLHRLPSVGHALDGGEISTGHVDALAAVATRRRLGVAGRQCDELVAQARRLAVDDFAIVCRHWAHLADDVAPTRRDVRRADADYLYLSPTLFGDVDIDGRLGPVGGRIVMAAVDRFDDGPAEDDVGRRTPSARRAGALVDCARAALEGPGHGDTGDPSSPSARVTEPVINVVIDHRTLTGTRDDLAGIRCDLDRVGPIAPAVMAELSCSATVRRVVLDAAGNVVDIGRRARVVSTAQRHALVVRDRHCVFPGCDRSARWCDAHHLVPWAAGGPTDLQNLVLLCRRHHTLVHRGGWSLSRDPTNGGVQARGPDGRRLVRDGQRVVVGSARGDPPLE